MQATPVKGVLTVQSIPRLKDQGRFYPITYSLAQIMTTTTHNKKKTVKDKTLPPPGISMLKFNKGTVRKLWNVVHNMFEDLKIDLPHGVTAFVNEVRPGQVPYYVGDDLTKYLRDHKRRRYRMHLFVELPTKKEGVPNVINSLNIPDVGKQILFDAIRACAMSYFLPKDYHRIENMLPLTRLFFLRYAGKHGGHRLHLDAFNKRDGPVFIINLGESILDYVPFREVANEKNSKYVAYRMHIIMGDVFVMDGDSRFVYTHGVPPNDEGSKKYLRYAMLVRFPTYYKHTRLCYLTQKHMKSVDPKYEEAMKTKMPIVCYSDSQSVSLKSAKR